MPGASWSRMPWVARCRRIENSPSRSRTAGSVAASPVSATPPGNAAAASSASSSAPRSGAAGAARAAPGGRWLIRAGLPTASTRHGRAPPPRRCGSTLALGSVETVCVAASGTPSNGSTCSGSSWATP